MAVEWCEVTSTEWEDQLARLVWTPQRTSKGEVFAYTVQADCPRCKEPGIALRHPVEIIRANPAPVKAEIYAQCECSGEHPGRPADETGCGCRTSMIFTIPTGVGTP